MSWTGIPGGEEAVNLLEDSGEGSAAPSITCVLTGTHSSRRIVVKEVEMGPAHGQAAPTTRPRRTPFAYRKEWLGQALLAVTALSIFVILAGHVGNGKSLDWEVPLMLAIHQRASPWLDRLFLVVTWTAGAWVVLPLAAGVAFLLHRRRARLSKVIAFSSAVAGLGSLALKTIYARPRPDVFPPMAILKDFSFPSGHTLMAVGFYGVVALILARQGHWGGALAASLWVVLVALSRVYLGVHYPTDVLASLAAGLMWLAAIWPVSDPPQHRALHPPPGKVGDA